MKPKLTSYSFRVLPPVWLPLTLASAPPPWPSTCRASPGAASSCRTQRLPAGTPPPSSAALKWSSHNKIAGHSFNCPLFHVCCTKRKVGTNKLYWKKKMETKSTDFHLLCHPLWNGAVITKSQVIASLQHTSTGLNCPLFHVCGTKRRLSTAPCVLYKKENRC